MRISMKTPLAMLRAATAAAIGLGIANAHAMAPDKFYQKTAPSVWRIFTFDAAGKVFALGSAVVIGQETLLTNCHVLAKAKSFVIRQDNVSYEARLQHIDIERDLCQITARNLTAPAVTIGDSDKLNVGQHVYTLGNPQGLELTLSDGLISALRKDGGMVLRYIQTSAPFSQGSSGGGLFDEEGRLIGITTLVARDGQNLNFAIPINYLRDLPARSAEVLSKRAGTVRIKADRPPEPNSRAEGGADAPVKRTAPAPSGYADIKDTAKLDELKARKGYEDYLTRPLPRAFAITKTGGWWISSGTKPKNPLSSPDPALRVIPDCEHHHQRRCYLYAIDDVVVYKPDQP